MYCWGLGDVAFNRNGENDPGEINGVAASKRAIRKGCEN